MSTPLSLLWPHEPPENPAYWQANAATDLGLQHIITILNMDGKHERAIKSIFMTPCSDPETIAYRQEIIEDLLATPELAQQLTDLLPLVSNMAHYAGISEMEELQFQKTLSRLNELELFLQIVDTFGTFLDSISGSLRSAGLRALREMLLERMHDPAFEQMRRELPDITSKISKLASITLGVNLDHNLKPIAATILSVNTEPFQGSSLFKKLFGDRAEFQGITQLHTVPMQSVTTADGRLVPTQRRTDPLLTPLFRDLDRIINDSIRPVAAALKQFMQVSTQFLVALEPEIVFYLGAARLITSLTACGLKMCRAEVASIDARLCQIHDCTNINLAIRTMERQPDTNLAEQVVTNEVNFDDDGRIMIITGPNQGGKTTYIQAVGLAQVLFQAGLYVPGSSACISPVDNIYTHFPVEEKPNTKSGRFGEEAQRLNDIFNQATRHSLILLNESLASTASGESLYLARDIVRCFRLLGVRAAYTTHMHELAAAADELNSTTPGESKVLSLVAIAQTHPNTSNGDTVKRTYKIISSPPMGRSYARELADRYGISYDKLVETLTSRNVLDASVTDAVSD